MDKFTNSSDNKVVVSIDTEAQPNRAINSQFEKLIDGRFGSDSGGIHRMMDIADRYGVTLSFFLDYAEVDLYGEKIIRIGQEIDSRGHDVQLHFHPEFLSEDTLKKHGCDRQKLDEIDSYHASAYVEILLGRHMKATGKSASAFRGGGYRYSHNLLKELSKHGIKVSSNHNRAKADRGFELKYLSNFLWEDVGVTEVPVACLQGFRNLDRTVAYNFNSGVFLRDSYSVEQVISRHLEFQKEFFIREGQQAICCLVMHSWSLLKKDNKDFFSGVNEHSVDVFEHLLKALKANSLDTTFDQVSKLNLREIPTVNSRNAALRN